MMVACQWNKSSPTGPAEQWAGGSRCKSLNSFWIRFSAMGQAAGAAAGPRVPGCRLAGHADQFSKYFRGTISSTMGMKL